MGVGVCVGVGVLNLVSCVCCSNVQTLPRSPYKAVVFTAHFTIDWQ